MDLADLAQLDAPARQERFRQAWEDGAHIVRLRVPWALIQPQPDVWDWEAFEQVVRPNESALPARSAAACAACSTSWMSRRSDFTLVTTAA